MNNIMVCVTKQKTCQRLIDYGKKLKKSDDDQLFVIHIAKSDDSFLDNSEEGKHWSSSTRRREMQARA